ncbi:WecB/TagA/CpsF family glycosyltransferase, partial [Patescibacteria group bacterium]|nr:WecB/TagA/CpsF family glycosyltransferase [Patescibacteria group bacterium]
LNKFSTVKIAIGVGGAFDFISGTVKRCPSLLRKIGLEWLWRFFAQPWRYDRIKTATYRFIKLVINSRGKPGE